MTITNREAFERGTNTFNAHDMDGFAEVVADDVAVVAPGVRVVGKPAFIDFFGSWLSAFPDAHVEVHNVYFIDDIAVEEGTFSGTHDGVLRAPTGEIPPSGRAVNVDYVHVLRYRNGLHTSFKLVFDRMQMLEQLGLVPTSAVAA